MHLRLTLLALTLFAPPTAYGAGFMVSKIGGDSAGATTDSPSSIYWNPAAIGRIDGTRLYIDNNLIYRTGSFTRDTTYVKEDGERYEAVDLTSFSSQPMVAVTSDLGSKSLTFGLGAYAPFGSSSEWDDRDGPQRFEGIFGRITAIYVTPAVTWEVVDGLYLAAAPSYVNILLQSYRARDLGEIVEERSGNEVAAEDPANEGRVYLDFAGHAFSYAFGVLWEVGDLVIGASYTSEVDVELDGTLEVYLPRSAFYRGLSPDDIDEPATLRTTWPRALRGGVSWSATERWVLSAKVEWVQWSLYDAVEIDVEEERVPGVGDLDTTSTVGWQDTTNLRLGARYALTPTLSVFGGGGFENGAIPEERLSPSIIDLAKVGLALGFRWWVTDDVELNVSYTHIEFLDTEAKRSVETIPHTGSYSQRVEFLNTNLTWRVTD